MKNYLLIKSFEVEREERREREKEREIYSVRPVPLENPD